MAELIARAGPYEPRPPLEDHFAALARSILYQQLAGRAATAIHGRFVALFPDGKPTPEGVLALPDGALRGAGLSGAKAAAIRDLAAKVSSGQVPLSDVDSLSDEELIARLSTVRGIGPWTAEMFAIFQLRRLDIWPVDDYGVRKGYALAYRLPELPKSKELERLGERFRPYRSVVAWYCWRAAETTLPQ